MEGEAGFPIDRVRAQYPALSRRVGDNPAVYFDGPAGSQVPSCVIEAVADYLGRTNANTHGRFATSRESDAMIEDARRAVATFLGASDPDCVAFGANMTTLTLAIARSIGRDWSDRDEVVVTRLDHDANITPWELAARDAGATVRRVGFRPEDTTLDLDELMSAIGERTAVVAIGAAANSTGTVNPIRSVVERAHEVGAKVFVDAVHYAPHRLIDVDEWGCDLLACSAYKFFGPHVGILWGKRELLESLPAYQVRPAADELPDRFSTGTGNLEGIAGVRAAIDYLAGLVAPAEDRRNGLSRSYQAIQRYEEELLGRLLDGIDRLSAVRLWGISARDRFPERVPTVAVTHDRIPASALAEALGDRGFFVWDGHFYAVEVTEHLGLEPEGMVRIGLLHYNTAEEVDRLLAALDDIG